MTLKEWLALVSAVCLSLEFIALASLIVVSCCILSSRRSIQEEA
jgi:hypothetical protein